MNDLFRQIRDSEARAKARRLQALERFHVGDVAYPIGIRSDVSIWGIVVDVNPTIHKIVLNLNGVIRQFEPEELILTNPEEKEGNREVEDKERVQRVVEETVGKAFKANRRDRIARRIATAMANRRIVADGDDYRYDPEHKHKPQGGGWQKTEKGWSKQKKEKGESSKPAPMTEEQRLLDRRSQSQSSEDRLEVARSKSAHPETLARLADDPRDEICRAVACNPRTPAEILVRMAKDKHLRPGVAANQSAPAALLAEIANDEDGDKKFGEEGMTLRKLVAGNPGAPAATLKRLAEHGDWQVRSRVAENPSSPASALNRLAGDENLVVRDHIAKNRHAPAQALEKLAGDKIYMVRESVANNPSASASALEKLAMDGEADIRRMVVHNPSTSASTLDKLAADENESVRNAVANCPNTPISALEKLAEDEDEYNRASVALNPRTPVSLLENLAEDVDKFVRSSVAGSSKTPVSLLGKLAKDENRSVRGSVARNLFTPSAVRQMALESGDTSGDHGAAAARSEVAQFKKALGSQNHRGRSLAQLQADFLNNMDPSKYDSAADFLSAKKRVAKLTPADFGMLMKAVMEDEEA